MNLPIKKQKICDGVSKICSNMQNVYVADVMNSGHVLNDAYELQKSIMLKFGALDLSVSDESIFIRIGILDF